MPAAIAGVILRPALAPYWTARAPVSTPSHPRARLRCPDGNAVRVCVLGWSWRAQTLGLFSGFRGAPELVRVLERVGFCVVGGEPHKNVGDCRTSFLGIRSKGKALHESVGR